MTITSLMKLILKATALLPLVHNLFLTEWKKLDTISLSLTIEMIINIFLILFTTPNFNNGEFYVNVLRVL